MRILGKYWKQRVDALYFLQPAYEEKIWPRMRRVSSRRRLRCGHEVCNHSHQRLESAPVMHLLGETSRRDKGINRANAFLQQMRVSPPLRRPFKFERAAKTIRLFTEALVILPEHVHGTDQPVLVGGVKLDEVGIVGLQLP